MLHNMKFMEQFRGYTTWDPELQLVAKERMLIEYLEEQLIPRTNYDEYVRELKKIIKEDIAFYEKFEYYEVCQLLKDLGDEL